VRNAGYEVWVVAPTPDGKMGFGQFKKDDAEGPIIQTFGDAMAVANELRMKSHKVVVIERTVIRELPGEVPMPEGEEGGSEN